MEKTKYIVLKSYQAQDIDTLEDWKMLQIKYNFLKLNNEKTI